MRKRRKTTNLETQRLPMTPLIDIVFLLLTFFIITFKVTAPEGEFGVKMPQTGGVTVPLAAQALPGEIVRVRLFADADGKLADIQIRGLNLGPNPQKLREQIINLVGTAPTQQERDAWEVMIDFDRNLKYQYTFDVLSAIKGYLSGGKMILLIEKINFAE